MIRERYRPTIAKEIGATWGTVKYQFGDADGFWAAVLRTRRSVGPTCSPAPITAPLRVRVSGIVDTLYDGLTSTDSRAIETLRAAMPRDREELERLYPLTAGESIMASGWLATCQTRLRGWTSTPVA